MKPKSPPIPRTGVPNDTEEATRARSGNLRIAACLHVAAETSNLLLTLTAEQRRYLDAWSDGA